MLINIRYLRNIKQIFIQLSMIVVGKEKVKMKIPYIKSDWSVLFKPEKHGKYVNDHSIIKAHDGCYHLFGITSFEGGAPNEKYFVHGITPSLDKQMYEHDNRAIDRGTLAWAPCVVQTEGDYYYMFYGPSPTSLSVSFELHEWYNHTVYQFHLTWLSGTITR